MSDETINGMVETINYLEKEMRFIYEELALIFSAPCNFSPIDEIMSDCEKCREDCGKITDAECWQRYFELRYAKCKESDGE